MTKPLTDEEKAEKAVEKAAAMEETRVKRNERRRVKAKAEDETETETESFGPAEFIILIVIAGALLWWAVPSSHNMEMHYRQQECELRTYEYCGDNRVNSFRLWLNDIRVKLK